MHRARDHAATRTRERRQRLAHEAARLMAEGGFQDMQQARAKAVGRLGIRDEASLPCNAEIEAALRERQRLFAGPQRDAALHRRRTAAVDALEFLRAFSPRLAGPVLEGTADANSPILLLLHEDDPDAVQRFLEEHGIPAQARSRRMRLDRERVAEVPTWTFTAEELPFELRVLPYDALRQAPLSPVDDRPMRRASLSQLRALLDPAPPELPTR